MGKDLFRDKRVCFLYLFLFMLGSVLGTLLGYTRTSQECKETVYKTNVFYWQLICNYRECFSLPPNSKEPMTRILEKIFTLCEVP